MKVIMIRKWKNYEIDQVVEVANGFGTNFLIKNGYALPINKATSHSLEIRQEHKKEEHEHKRNEALKLKDQLEKLNLVFYLKTTHEVIHHSVTTKKVNQALIEQGFKLEKHVLPHIAIHSLGQTVVDLKLYDGIIAKLTIEVRGEQ